MSVTALKQRHHQQRDDVDDLDERIDRGAGGVLVAIADGVASQSCRASGEVPTMRKFISLLEETSPSPFARSPPNHLGLLSDQSRSLFAFGFPHLRIGL